MTIYRQNNTFYNLLTSIQSTCAFFLYKILKEVIYIKNNLIGNTPIIKINYEYKNKLNSVYTKLEFYNITGSIKDRVAYYMIIKAKQKGLLKENMPIIEATSGNTGISLSALGAYFKHPVYIFMPDWVSQERIKIMQMYGANVTLISKEEGGFTKCIENAEELAFKLKGFLTNQFSNLDNLLAHYETTGVEILKKIIPDGFISGIGTGGTLIGTGKKLKEVNPDVKIYALEPTNMALIKTGRSGSHKIEGIGDEFIPNIVDLDIIDDIILIDDEEAIVMAQNIAKTLGIGIGISSGANLLASILMHETVEGNIVTVFPDDMKKYITTDLSKTINNSKLIANQIKLLDYEII